MQNTWQHRAKSAMKGKITQEKLAEKLGITQGGLGHWLNGRNQASLDDVNRIADGIGISRAWLTHGLGYERGPGKELIDILLSGRLEEADLQALALTAKTFAEARSQKLPAVETADFAPAPRAVNPDIPALKDK